MKKLELLDEQMEITLRGESHIMRLPTNGDLIKLQRAKDEGEESESMDTMYGFLKDLGLPSEFVDKMTPGQVVKIMETAANTKE